MGPGFLPDFGQTVSGRGTYILLYKPGSYRSSMPIGHTRHRNLDASSSVTSSSHFFSSSMVMIRPLLPRVLCIWSFCGISLILALLLRGVSSSLEAVRCNCCGGPRARTCAIRFSGRMCNCGHGCMMSCCYGQVVPDIDPACLLWSDRLFVHSE